MFPLARTAGQESRGAVCSSFAFGSVSMSSLLLAVWAVPLARGFREAGYELSSVKRSLLSAIELVPFQKKLLQQSQSVGGLPSGGPCGYSTH